MRSVRMEWLLVVFAACSSPTVTTSAVPIVGGQPDLSDSNVVALVPPGFPTNVTCSGTLIAPRIVLTAGHCISGTVPSIDAYFGTDTMLDPGVEIPVVAQLVHPLYNPDGLINDLSLLVLASDAPATPKPLPTVPLSDADVGAPLRLVGFGSTHSGPPGPKYEGATTIDGLSDDKIAFHANPAQTCVGDSGGPAFFTSGGVEVLVGVTSSGDAACTTSAHDVRVDAEMATFIEPFVQATAPGVAGLGDHCVSDDNCASGMCIPSADDASFSYCSTGCTSVGECVAGMGCDSISDVNAGGPVCHYQAPTGTVGDICAVDFDCRSGVCGRVGSTPLGQCTVLCSADMPCDTGLECLTLSSELSPSFTGCAVPPPPPGGTGCSSSRSSGLGGALLILLALLQRRGANRA